MELPIPNFYFMGVQFIHLLALSVWVGGIVTIGFIIAPTLFQKMKSRRTAGELMGEILRKFDIVTLFCIVALIVTGVIKYWSWENLTPWNLIRYLAILVMSTIGLYSALVVSPQMRTWVSGQTAVKGGISAVVTPSGSRPIQPLGLVEKVQPSLPDFNRLHHVSVRLMVINLVCGVIALLMA